MMTNDRLQQVERGCLERVVDELISSPSACLLFLYSICITKVSIQTSIYFQIKT